MSQVTIIPPGPRSVIGARLQDALSLINQFERLFQIGRQFGHADVIRNIPPGPAKDACTELQEAVQRQAILSVVQVFEEANSEYDIVALRQIIKQLEDNPLPISCSDPDVLRESCQALDPKLDPARKQAGKQPRCILLWCRQALSAGRLKLTITYLRNVRNKMIAHKEYAAVSNDDKIGWDDIHAAVLVAKRVGTLLMNAFVMENERISIAEDVAPNALRLGAAFRGLLQRGTDKNANDAGE